MDGVFRINLFSMLLQCFHFIKAFNVYINHHYSYFLQLSRFLFGINPLYVRYNTFDGELDH